MQKRTPIFVLLLNFICSFGWAQSQQIADTTEIKSSIVFLDAFEISGNKWKEKERVGQIESIAASTIQLKSIHNSADVLAESGQVYVQKSQLGGGSPMIRGMAANKVLLVYNGMRMNNAIFRSGNLQNSMLIDPNTLEKAEIHLGGNSLLFGSDALGGVVHYQSVKPQTTDSLNIGGTLKSSFNSANSGTNFHGRFTLSDKLWALSVNHAQGRFGDLKMGKKGGFGYERHQYAGRSNGRDTILTNSDPYLQRQSGYNQTNSGITAVFKPNDHLFFEYEYLSSNSSNIPRYDRLYSPEQIDPNDSTLNGFNYAEWYYGPQQWEVHRLNVQHSTDNAIYNDVQFQISHQDYTESRNSRKWEKTELKRNTENVGVWAAQLDFWKKGNWDFKYGLDVQLNAIRSKGELINISTGESNQADSRYPDNSTWDSYGAYFQTEKHLGNGTVKAGMRYNLFSIFTDFTSNGLDYQGFEKELAFSGTAYNLSYHHQIGDKLELFALTNSAFRAPNIDDLGKVFDSSPGNVVVPNPDLQPEISWNKEVGMYYNSEATSLSVGFFHTDVFGSIVLSDESPLDQDSILYAGTPSKVQTLDNKEMAVVFGSYFKIAHRWSDHWKTSANINWQKGYVSGNNREPLRHVTPVFGSMAMTYTSKHWQSVLSANYAGEVSPENLAPSEQDKEHLYVYNSNDELYSPSWFRLDFMNSFQLKENISLQAGIENILDRQYRPYSSGIAAPGRNIRIGFSVQL